MPCDIYHSGYTVKKESVEVMSNPAKGTSETAEVDVDRVVHTEEEKWSALIR